MRNVVKSNAQVMNWGNRKVQRSSMAVADEFEGLKLKKSSWACGDSRHEGILLVGEYTLHHNEPKLCVSRHRGLLIMSSDWQWAPVGRNPVLLTCAIGGSERRFIFQLYSGGKLCIYLSNVSKISFGVLLLSRRRSFFPILSQRAACSLYRPFSQQPLWHKIIG